MLFDAFKEEMLDLYGHKSEKSNYWKDNTEVLEEDNETEVDESNLTKCDDCEFNAKSISGLKIHVTRKHKVKNISCP